MTTTEKEAAWLQTRIDNLKDQRDHATFEIKECEERLRDIAAAIRRKDGD
jgi:predicted  nucleic acid-binding Zn-ribbon protein